VSPLSWILVLALVGAIAVVGGLVVTECRDAELVVLPATVVDTAIVVRERTVTTTQAPCPVCPGASPTVVTSVVQEETFFVTLDVAEGGQVSRQRVEVSEALYRRLQAGDAVEWRVQRGRTGRLCSRPEILAPEPAR
jgi:hypothetical protein